MRKKLFQKSNSRNSFSLRGKLAILSLGVLFTFLLGVPDNAMAVPSFARQTGLACSACHTVFPELTSFGRQFKLNGYTLTNIKTIAQKETTKNDKSGRDILNLLHIPQVSLMFQTGFTQLAKTIPGTQNGNFEFPQQLSFFYAGQIAPHMGAFIQFTMDDGSGTFGMDNTDIRFANQGKGKTALTYGLTINNNPTVQDLWNSTPAWGYPYTSSGTAPGPGAATVIENLGGTVAGVGGYAMIGNSIYLELDGYRTAQMGAALPPDASVAGALKGTSPYWRIAFQHQWDKSYLMVGSYGIATKLFPAGVTGATDDYTDIAFDLQYEYPFNKGQFTLHSTYIHEKQALNASFASGASSSVNNTLNKFRADASVFFRPGLNFTLGYFNLTGSSNLGLYAPGAVSGFANGLPNSNGLRFQFDYLPWENTKISVQYFAYSKFNGASANYDGAGRSAADNNMFYVQLWFLF